MRRLLFMFLLLGLLGCTPKTNPSVANVNTPSTQRLAPTASPEPTATPEPTASPEPTPTVDKIERLIDSMTAKEKIGQLFIFSIRENKSKVFDEAMKATLDSYSPGGVVLFSENIESKEQTKQLIEDLQAYSKIPLIISSDDEGGRVRRITRLLDQPLSTAQSIGATNDTQVAYDRGREIGRILFELGVTMDFAPVADINTNPNNTVIGDRAFGSDPVLVGKMVVATIEGLHDENVHSVIKHFPGHGDTIEDSHNGLAKIDHTLERLKDVEFVPFQMGMDAGVDGVMVGHITAPNITGDHDPAVFSKRFVTEILRGEFGFDGCIITDSLQMGAITNDYGSGEAALRAFEAGVDIILMPQDNDAAYHALLDAYTDGRISESRLRESLERIIQLKYPEE